MHSSANRQYQCCHWGQSRQHQIAAFFNVRYLRYSLIGL